MGRRLDVRHVFLNTARPLMSTAAAGGSEAAGTLLQLDEVVPLVERDRANEQKNDESVYQQRNDRSETSPFAVRGESNGRQRPTTGRRIRSTILVG